MMREHKYRARDLVLGKMFYFSLRNPMNIAKTYKNEQGIFVDRYVVMQYTGLTDKNGTEIYEGDIGWDEHRECYGIVMFDEGKFVYVWENICEDLFETNIEVIGNVYEDSHLLED